MAILGGLSVEGGFKPSAYYDNKVQLVNENYQHAVLTLYIILLTDMQIK